MTDMHDHVKALKEKGVLSPERIASDREKAIREQSKATNTMKRDSNNSFEVVSTIVSACVVAAIIVWFNKSCDTTSENQVTQPKLTYEEKELMEKELMLKQLCIKSGKSELEKAAMFDLMSQLNRLCK